MGVDAGRAVAPTPSATSEVDAGAYPVAETSVDAPNPGSLPDSGEEAAASSADVIGMAPAYVWSEMTGGSLFVLVSTNADRCGGAGTTTLSFQTTGAITSTTYQTSRSLLAIVTNNACTCSAYGVPVDGTLTIDTLVPSWVQGTFSADVGGNAVTGSFSVPITTGCDHLPVCDGG